MSNKALLDERLEWIQDNEALPVCPACNNTRKNVILQKDEVEFGCDICGLKLVFDFLIFKKFWKAKK